MSARLPATLEPELATLVDKPRPGDWLYEIKFDGYRMLARVGGPRDVRIFTRRGNDWTQRFPRLVKELVAAKLPPGWYDGEIVMLDREGKPSFNALQLAIEGGRNDAIVFYLFDAPWLDGRDMRALPVEERRAALQAVLRETPLLRFSQEVGGARVHDIVASACRLGLEGVIGKRRGSPYVHRRSDDWIKLKCMQRQEFVIGGFTWPDNSRTDAGLGALLVGVWDEEGVFQYAGKVGTGFTGEVSAMLRKRLEAMAVPRRPFARATGHDRHATWVRTELLCEVTYAEWPEGGSLRHAAFKGLREDKTARDVQREEPAVDEAAHVTSVAKAQGRERAASRGAAPEARSTAALRSAPTHARTVTQLTRPDRIIDTTTGFTKLDLALWFAAASPWMLPQVAQRHAYVKRAPEGLAGKVFFQQHPEQSGMKGTDPALWPGHEPAFAFDTGEDLLVAVQLGVVEIHTWNSRAATIAQPDFVVFDLDPGDALPWPALQEGAQLVRAMLKELGLQSWLRTTGGKGLHVVVPVLPEFDYPSVKGFSMAVVRHLARTFPQLFVATSGPRNRVGRIFIDYLRNGQSQSTIASYSARARPGMGVAMPVAWSDLPRLRGGDHWDIRTGMAHLAQRKRDPWAQFFKARQSLAEPMATLQSRPIR